MAITGEDEAYVRASSQWKHCDLPVRHFVEGDCVRDWACDTDQVAPFMYKVLGDVVTVLDIDQYPASLKQWWPLRTNLKRRLMFGNCTLREFLTPVPAEPGERNGR
jgi:hypothetical protein